MNKIGFVPAKCLVELKNTLVCDGVLFGSNSALALKMEAAGSDRITSNLAIHTIHGKSLRGSLRGKKPIFSQSVMEICAFMETQTSLSCS